MKLASVQKALGLSSADEIDAANAVKAAPPPTARAGSQAPQNLGESVIHAAADVALDRLNALLGASPEVRDAFLKSGDGKALRNVLRRYAAHCTIASLEAEQ